MLILIIISVDIPVLYNFPTVVALLSQMTDGWLCLFCSMLKLIKPSDWLIVFILQYAEVDQAIWLVDCVYFVVCWSWSSHLIGWLCLFCSMLKLIKPSDWLIVFILQYVEVDQAIWLVDCVYFAVCWSWSSHLIGWLCLFCSMLKLIKPSDWLIVFILQYVEVDQAIWLVDCVYFAVCWSWSSHLIGWLCLFCSMLKLIKPSDWLIVFIL